MNIIEAVKSGKMFKRRGSKDTWHVTGDRKQILRFFPDELLADDWETEPEKITITMLDFLKAFVDMPMETATAVESFRTVTTRLGFSKTEIEEYIKNEQRK